MNPMAGFDLAPWLKTAAGPAAGAVVGFFVSRWTMSKKDRRDFEQKNYENTLNLIAQHDAAYEAYTRALQAYSGGTAADADNFVEIATKGDRYFFQLNVTCGAILSDKVDVALRDEVLLPKVRGAAARTLPAHYGALRAIADKHGFAYSGELRRTDYGAVYAVVEKFGAAPAWEGNTAGS